MGGKFCDTRKNHENNLLYGSSFNYHTSLGSEVTVTLASTSWQQLGGMGAVSYGRYWLNCWKKKIIVDANSLASVGRNPAVKYIDKAIKQTKVITLVANKLKRQWYQKCCQWFILHEAQVRLLEVNIKRHDISKWKYETVPKSKNLWQLILEWTTSADVASSNILPCITTPNQPTVDERSFMVGWLGAAIQGKMLLHSKNKLVVLTTEWLPWLQTSWRDCGYALCILLIA